MDRRVETLTLLLRFRFLNLLASLCTSHAANFFAACRLAAYPYPHRAQQHMDLRFFPHASKCDNTRGRTHAVCPLAHRHLLRLLSPQRSLQAAILVRSAVITLSRRPSLSWRLTHLSFSIVCTFADLALFRRSTLHSNPT